MLENPETYLELIKKGYVLNDIGKSSSQIIKELDIGQMALKVFQNKALIGQYIHNQKCQFSGKTINDWLSDPAQIAEFLQVMIEQRLDRKRCTSGAKPFLENDRSSGR